MYSDWKSSVSYPGSYVTSPQLGRGMKRFPLNDQLETRTSATLSAACCVRLLDGFGVGEIEILQLDKDGVMQLFTLFVVSGKIPGIGRASEQQTRDFRKRLISLAKIWLATPR